jgi:hypothetical protein
VISFFIALGFVAFTVFLFSKLMDGEKYEAVTAKSD